METDRNQQEALRKAAELSQMLNSLEKVDDEGRRASLLDTLCATEDVLSMPMHSTPPGISSGELTVDLLKHQARVLLFVVATTSHIPWIYAASSIRMVHPTRKPSSPQCGER